ncbi:unnamed protein product [Brachionus calyciflorus]|uniref:MPV17 n=1 Tax=Brachionus calyciflorus TaxID=104777 RepID=A0A814BUY7_9BILA|nr:unnamed protein product [Brachionus calyciflorus]
MLNFLKISTKLKKNFKYGVFGNTLIGIFLRGFGDTIQQNIEIKSNQNQGQKFDLTRTKNISLTGVVIGPLNYYWYKYLDTKYPTKTPRIIIKKILLDQIYGATFFTFLFIVIVCLLDGKTIRESLSEFVEKFPFIYLVDWLLWPPSQALNFYLVPKEFRVIFVNLTLVCWNIFLSYVKYN